ncbi:uncharacterized protein LOC126481928 [Schistocerca serialis cubense]|uniref:uncharacterized protein LOC126481928 n=1 Tax=Schistocerca serialis cubense TaxID=2023355 RepID=UPI00214EC4F5|nr:uncharacterized protein LOC126481928 [Schistocerca serialis cubense]
MHKENGNQNSYEHNNITLKENGEEINDPKEVCEKFIQKFSTVGTNEVHVKPQNFSLGKSSQSFYIHGITERAVLAIISALPPKMSCGWDDISPKLLKECRDELVKPQTHLINTSLRNGVFPDLLKITEIIPVHKKGLKTDTENYSPIPLTSELVPWILDVNVLLGCRMCHVISVIATCR